MQGPRVFHVSWPRLERHRIPGHCCEMVLVEPADCLFARGESNSVAILLSSCTALVVCRFVVPLYVSRTDEQDVALPSNGALVSESCFEIRYSNLEGRPCVWNSSSRFLVIPNLRVI